MQGSINRVRTLIHGGVPDRTPLYELLRNDAVIEHFTGVPLTVENGAELVYRAFEPAVDATRPLMKSPNAERVETLPDGRTQRYFRWTIWVSHRQYSDAAHYEIEKRREISEYTDIWTNQDQEQMEAYFTRIQEYRQKLGEVFLFPGLSGPGLTSLYDEVGLEQFSYYLADCPAVIDGLIEMNCARTLKWIEHLPENHSIEAGFLGDDIAYKSGPLFSPRWMRTHYFPFLERIIQAYHRKGIKVLFHSDGNLNPILEDLVRAGIDGLNPIEILADMNPGDIHRRYPHLFMSGGIDVSQLLPFGTPDQIKAVVKRTIQACDGKIMVGSSTELNNEVPLANYLALREAVLES